MTTYCYTKDKNDRILYWSVDKQGRKKRVTESVVKKHTQTITQSPSLKRSKKSSSESIEMADVFVKTVHYGNFTFDFDDLTSKQLVSMRKIEPGLPGSIELSIDGGDYKVFNKKSTHAERGLKLTREQLVKILSYAIDNDVYARHYSNHDTVSTIIKEILIDTHGIDWKNAEFS